MQITIRGKKLERNLGTEAARVRAYGADAAKTLYRRMAQLSAAPTLDVMRTLPGNCHELVGGRAGQLAVEITKGTRLIFVPTDDPPPDKPDGGLDWSKVTAITIVEVTDYHG